MLKREREEDEHKSYGHGKKWFRGSMIGKGSSGSVYLATLKNPKWLFTHLPLPRQMVVKSAEVSDSGSLQKERLVLANLQGSPYIRKCFTEEITTGDNDEMVYNLLLEYGSGGTLADLIKKSGRFGLPESDVRHYTRYLLLGLTHTHWRNYVHRDLKPENIILVPTINSTEYILKISDYGSAKNVKTMKKRRPLEPYLRGNVRYLSPEAVFDNIQEPPSDIWALGCIVVEMLTGKSLWDGKRDCEVEDILYEMGSSTDHGFPQIPEDISEEAKDFLKGCFARKPMRSTAEMLLHQRFVAGLDDDDEEEEEEEEEVVGEVGPARPCHGCRRLLTVRTRLVDDRIIET